MFLLLPSMIQPLTLVSLPAACGELKEPTICHHKSEIFEPNLFPFPTCMKEAEIAVCIKPALVSYGMITAMKKERS